MHGLSIVRIGMIAWIPFLSAALGGLAGGALAGILIRLGVPTPPARKWCITLSALLMTAAIPAALTTSLALAVGLIATATFGYTSYTANTLPLPADVFPRNTVGSIWGLASMGSGLGGMLFSWLGGRVIDRYGYVPVFVAYGIMPLVALAIVLFLLGPLRPDPRFWQTAC